MALLLQATVSSGAPLWSYAAPILSAIAASCGIFLSYNVYKAQRLMNQRQLIVPLWQYISSISDIDSSAPITPDVIKAVNTLELVAITCEGGMIDKNVIKRTFASQFRKHYDAIHRCDVLPGTNKRGQDFLNENPATIRFYNELMQDHQNQGNISQGKGFFKG